MPEQWINPVAWAPGLVRQLVGRGWKTFQLDLEGGLLSAETIAWAIDCVQCSGAGLVVRVPADDLPSIRRLAKYGVRRFLVPGFANVGELKSVVETARAHADTARVIAMIESRTLLAAVPEIADVDGVSGVHFGLFDLCRDMGIARWREVDRLPREVVATAGEARAHGLIAGTYMLPSWRGSDWPRHFDVLSHVLSEFAVPEGSASPMPH